MSPFEICLLCRILLFDLTTKDSTLQVDAIVNTTAKDFNLNGGAVSASILKAAGQSIQVKYPYYP